MHQLEAINETSYLSVPNAGIYRKIMRCFFYNNYRIVDADLFDSS
jgi:hypothetical protein